MKKTGSIRMVRPLWAFIIENEDIYSLIGNLLREEDKNKQIEYIEMIVGYTRAAAHHELLSQDSVE